MEDRKSPTSFNWETPYTNIYWVWMPHSMPARARDRKEVRPGGENAKGPLREDAQRTDPSPQGRLQPTVLSTLVTSNAEPRPPEIKRLSHG